MEPAERLGVAVAAAAAAEGLRVAAGAAEGQEVGGLEGGEGPVCFRFEAALLPLGGAAAEEEGREEEEEESSTWRRRRVLATAGADAALAVFGGRDRQRCAASASSTFTISLARLSFTSRSPLAIYPPRLQGSRERRQEWWQGSQERFRQGWCRWRRRVRGGEGGTGDDGGTASAAPACNCRPLGLAEHFAESQAECKEIETIE